MKAHIRKHNDFEENEEHNPYLKAAILEVVDNQLEGNDPPETGQTLDRLMAAGYTEQQAKEKIAVIVAYHIYDIMHDNKEFDREKFVSDLQKIE
ncbi:MAG: DUF1841 family protein [Ruminiclostridium sp.]|nr:DUF1841 family protein [Ruminiclostridium sp.]